MKQQEILEILTKIFIDEFEVEKEDINDQAHLYNDLGLDSLDSVDLIVCLENEFNFKVDRITDGPRLKEIRLVQDIIDYILEKEKEG